VCCTGSIGLAIMSFILNIVFTRPFGIHMTSLMVANSGDPAARLLFVHDDLMARTRGSAAAEYFSDTVTLELAAMGLADKPSKRSRAIQEDCDCLGWLLNFNTGSVTLRPRSHEKWLRTLLEHQPRWPSSPKGREADCGLVPATWASSVAGIISRATMLFTGARPWSGAIVAEGGKARRMAAGSKIRLTQQAIDNLAFWRRALLDQGFLNVPMVVHRRLLPRFRFFTDARAGPNARIGWFAAGIAFSGRVDELPFVRDTLKLDPYDPAFIAVWELLAVHHMVAWLAVYQPSWLQDAIWPLHVDNTTSLADVSKARVRASDATGPARTIMVQDLGLWSLRFGFQFWPEYIRSENNTIADPLSRADDFGSREAFVHAVAQWALWFPGHALVWASPDPWT